MKPNPFEALIAPIEQRMCRTVARLVRDVDDTADTMQDVLATVWKSLDKIQTHPNPQAYVMKICVSRAYDTLRRRSRRSAREISIEDILPSGGADFPDSVSNSQPAIGSEEIAEGVLAAIAQLPPQQSQAVMLRLVGECSFTEIAQALECAEATAYSHYSKGKSRLREKLTPLGMKKDTLQ